MSALREKAARAFLRFAAVYETEITRLETDRDWWRTTAEGQRDFADNYESKIVRLEAENTRQRAALRALVATCGNALVYLDGIDGGAHEGLSDLHRDHAAAKEVLGE